MSRIERIGTTTDQLRFYFSTHNVTDSAPSTAPVEFASMDVYRDYVAGERVEIIPTSDLFLQDGTDSDDWGQHFGRGHVVLSVLWNKATSDVDDFFDAFDLIAETPADTEFTFDAARISSFGTSRVPKYIPTIGQSRALVGSSSRFNTPINPGYDNLYVTEQDQGLGNQVDLESESGINPSSAVERYGYTGGLTHRVVKLIVDATATGSSATFYDDEILPRLRVLFGRNPRFGDYWFNGTRVMFFTGDSWIG